jgi:hypothetical protein
VSRSGQDPHPSLPAESPPGLVPDGTRPAEKAFGLPWGETYALVVGLDGTVSVNREARPGFGYAVARPGGMRVIQSVHDYLMPPARAMRMLPVCRALDARDRALGDACESCCTADEFVAKDPVLPRGPSWDRAVHTALLGNWTDPLERGRAIGPDAPRSIRAEARTLHRQMVPLWQHRVRGSRVQLLEAPLGEGLTLYDLVAGDPRMDDAVFESAFGDERIESVLAGLDATERRVAMAWAHPSIAHWTEAARSAGARDPEAFGERVRRKLKRLGARHTARAGAAAVTRGVSGA